MNVRTPRIAKIMFVSLCAICYPGCLYRVEYKSIYPSCKIPPVAEAMIVDGSYGRANSLWQKSISPLLAGSKTRFSGLLPRAAKELGQRSTLPHISEREKLALAIEARHEFTSQIGSHDYRVIGFIGASGNGYTSTQSLKQAMAKRAAHEGGDILLITRSELVERPFVYQSPGTATTYYYGNMASTTYNPGQTYAGRIALPLAEGAVLKYSPGWDQKIRGLLALDDAPLKRAVSEIENIWRSERDYGTMDEKVNDLLNHIVPTSQPESQPSFIASPTSQPESKDPLAHVQAGIVTIRADDRLGSGFCVKNSRTIITAAHVVENTNVVFVDLPAGDSVSAVVFRFDSDSDLALLMLNRAVGLQPLQLRGGPLNIGEECFALGAPKGLSGTVTKGIVSATRTLRGVQLVQTDAAINKGNSGGPLVDRQGIVIGLCDFKLTGDAEGLGFAVGTEAINSILGR